MTISPSYVGEPECNGVIERFMRTLRAVPLSPSVPDARRGAAAHRRVHHPLQRRVAHRAAWASDAVGRSGRGTGGVAMIMLRTRSHSGARINDRRGGHTLISPVGVQETGGALSRSM